jgi:hypothetical protein
MKEFLFLRLREDMKCRLLGHGLAVLLLSQETVLFFTGKAVDCVIVVD